LRDGVLTISSEKEKKSHGSLLNLSSLHYSAGQLVYTIEKTTMGFLLKIYLLMPHNRPKMKRTNYSKMYADEYIQKYAF
jgi:hypothetical protein